MTTFQTVVHFLPELILVIAGTLIYLSGAFFNRTTQPTLLALIALSIIFLVLGSQGGQLVKDGQFQNQYSGPLYIDLFGHTAQWFILLAGLLLVLLTRRSGDDPLRAEYTGSLLMLLAGLMICARANDLILLFVGLELVSIPTYVLLYLGRSGSATQEATTKYFFLSILSSGLLLYGFSFIYGATGTTDLAKMPSKLVPKTSTAVDSSPAYQIVDGKQVALPDAGYGSVGSDTLIFAKLGMLLVVAGLGFRLTAVPFHFYAPDVYQGSSHPNAGLLSTMPKVAGVLVLIRTIGVSLPFISENSWQILIAISIITMTLGNVLALWQNNLRRLLAYSSIAHGGYLLIGVAVGLHQGSAASTVSGFGSSLFYVAVYTFATLGVFGVLAALGTEEEPVETVDQLAGLASQRTWSALAMAVFMFSLAGIPPLAGFWGKFNLILGSVKSVGFGESGTWEYWFVALSVIAMLNAAIAAAYYLRIVSTMFFNSPSKPLVESRNPGPKVAWSLCLLLVLLTSFFAEPMLKRANNAGVQVSQQQYQATPKAVAVEK